MAFGLFKENTMKSHNMLFIISCLGIQLLLNSPAMAATGTGSKYKNARTESTSTGKRVTGTVKFYNESKGFGFIHRDDDDKDVYVHSTGIKAINLKAGQKVSFIPWDGRKGLVAKDVEND